LHHTYSHIHEVLILSTCNRLEIYVVTEESEQGQQTISHYLADLQNITFGHLYPALYFYEGVSVAHHLMRVTCGLDSMILGEPQILGQVNHAYTEAQHVNTVGPILSRLFNQAIHTGKRARAETEISRHTTSVSHAAVRLAQKHIDLTEARTLIIGAGEMAELAASAINKYHPAEMAFINRTCARAEALADQLGGYAIKWHQLWQALTTADVVISSTGAPHPVIFAEELREILPQREGKPLVLIDIAVPRDIEEAVAELPGVIVYDIDDLNDVTDANMAQRRAAIAQVDVIIQQELDDFNTWANSRDIVPVLVELRQKISEIAQQELAQALHKLEGLDEHQQKVVEVLTHRIVNKILHSPTTRLKAEAANGNGQLYASALADLFDLASPLAFLLNDQPTTRTEPHPAWLGDGHER
jgi:glutamyl-tRNA reductase